MGGRRTWPTQLGTRADRALPHTRSWWIHPWYSYSYCLVIHLLLYYLDSEFLLYLQSNAYGRIILNTLTSNGDTPDAPLALIEVRYYQLKWLDTQNPRYNNRENETLSYTPNGELLTPLCVLYKHVACQLLTSLKNWILNNNALYLIFSGNLFCTQYCITKVIHDTKNFKKMLLNSFK